MKMPAKFINSDSAHNQDGVCTRCGRSLDSDNAIWLELDIRTGEYHDFGVPAEDSQGSFAFGPDCADALRKRVRIAVSRCMGGASQ